MSWVVGYLNEDIEASFEALPEDFQASFRRIVEYIKAKRLGENP